MPSFETISGYGSNGAIVHYCVTKESDALLKPEGFYLVDSGGQYLDGTTDITRTVVLGFITDDMKENYTAVLKGNLDLAMSVLTAIQMHMSWIKSPADRFRKEVLTIIMEPAMVSVTSSVFMKDRIR